MDEEIVLTDQEIKRITEAVLFAAGYPVTFDKLAEVTHTDAARIEKLVKEYAEEYNKTELPRGVQLLILGKACQLVTNEVFSDYVREALGVKSGGNLSRSSLETIAIIAYNQPVTRMYIEQVRGVDSTYAIGILLDRGLIKEVGRLDVPGRPHLYGTTEAFLRVFGLSSLDELPPLTERSDD